MSYAVDELWKEHQAVAPYPSGCLAVPSPIAGTAFFPGGYGLWNPSGSPMRPPLPVGGIMVLGHDFHSEQGYKKSFALGAEPESQPTWRALLKWCDDVEIDRAQCFFTNFFMGLREGSATTGQFPGAKDATFVSRCRTFLQSQLDAQRPRLVLTLGVWVPRLLAPLGGKALAPWLNATSFAAIDGFDALGALRSGIALHKGGSSTVAALSHPSFFPRSAMTRRFRGMTGSDAHSALLREATGAR